MRPGDRDALSLDRRTGELFRIHDGGRCELLGTVRRDALAPIFDRMPFAPAWAPLTLDHGFPPVVLLLYGSTVDELPEAVAGPVLAVVAHSVLKNREPAQ